MYASPDLAGKKSIPELRNENSSVWEHWILGRRGPRFACTAAEVRGSWANARANTGDFPPTADHRSVDVGWTDISNVGSDWKLRRHLLFVLRVCLLFYYYINLFDRINETCVRLSESILEYRMDGELRSSAQSIMENELQSPLAKRYRVILAYDEL